MAYVNFFECHVGLAVVECCHKTPALALGFESLATLFKVGIKLWQLLPEVVDCALEERVGYEQMLLNISLLYLISSLTGENYEFANYVLARKVDAWVWFAISLLLGAAYCLRQWYVCRNLIEYKVEL